MTSPSKSMNDELIRQNVERHEKVADQYSNIHSEIYNDIEQERLQKSLAEAIAAIQSGDRLSMDYGCGAGNLSKHLIDLGMRVVAADVTPSFTKMAADIDRDWIEPFILNGSDLAEVDDNTYDMIASYSVLHHIPDYHLAIREMIRVLKPGGILYLDHDAAEELWAPSPTLVEFQARSRLKPSPWSYAAMLFSPRWWRRRIRKTFNPRYAEEGDIHVWQDDHIEWPAIRQLCKEQHVDILRDEPYLLYYAHYDRKVYDAYKNRCSDVHLLVGRKQ